MVQVLYIDDDAGLARLLKRALAAEGMAVHHAESGHRGLEMLATGEFDIVALDHNLIAETGLELIPQLLKQDNAPPIIYVTGSDDVRVAVAALKAGAVDYVWKDVDGHYRELLVEAIKAALLQRKHQREREEAQRAVAAAKERAELLLAEVNHRVANSLALVASLATFQANAVADDAAKAALTEMKARILAIAGIHRRLYTSHDVRFVELDAYLKNLGEELLAVLGTENHRKTISIMSDPDIRLPTDRAISLAVIVTELVTNAFKYAYPDGQGEIRVRLARLDDGRGELTVEDDGVGRREDGPVKGTGLGTRVVRGIAGTMKAEVEYLARQPGTVARLTFPLPTD